ncbi:CYTH and CHAD domain-containing protein [Dactylosporangium aurantiacum]|uniref:CYTH and CHAD domain-containing protein n=1 Tax=Dactylosporangium aurantiacum TaxID=35754 RepID=A0A9Q9IJ03_9ACTN|nr:CYTH and CHAD domain-containing protein [Dactylosporangium aurantiacum]MDG6105667.1 CYTH and CHAD domain-containing protein [Dactylosporangium aurantiacum]UWZ57002.1 CYTH and CHAD domain-containing protein [Dactylosporangium aurantiacum]
MAEKLEVERKYELPDDFTMPSMIGIADVVRVTEPDDQHLDATYYDTAGLRLTSGRMTLRRRSGGHDAGWHLKRPSGGERSELQVPAGDDEQAPPPRITTQVRAVTRGEPLHPVALIRTHRVERGLQDAAGATVALVADDTVETESLIGARVAQRWRELEVELVDGSPDDLTLIDEALRAAGARPSASPSKLSRALGPDHPAAAAKAAGDGGTTGPAKPGDGKRDAGRRALVAYVTEQRDAVVAHDPQARAGDVEAVHDMRVATRRLRSTLRTFAPLLSAYEGDLDRLHDEIKWLTGLLGEVRDGDVMALRLADLLAAEPPELVVGPVAARVSELLAARTQAARERLIEGLDSDRYIALLNDIDALVAAAAAGGPAGKGRMRRLARRAVRRADRRLAAATARPEPVTAGTPAGGTAGTDVALHEARKAYKRARYAAELAAPVAGTPAAKLADRLKDLQDVLGAHQDAIVTAELLREQGMRAFAEGENAFTYGLLHARQAEHGRVALAGLPRARRRATRQKVRRWLW